MCFRLRVLHHDTGYVDVTVTWKVCFRLPVLHYTSGYVDVTKSIIRVSQILLPTHIAP